MFTGPQQQPFVCTTNQGAVNRQPLVDSANPPGYPVTDGQGQKSATAAIARIDTFVSYFYRSTSGALKAMPADGSQPARPGHGDPRQRAHGGLRDPPRDRVDQPVPLQHRDARAARRGPREPRHQPVEPQAPLLVPGRRRHRAQPGDRAQRLDESRHPRARLRHRAQQRQQHRHALQHEPRRRDGDDDQGALRRALRRSRSTRSVSAARAARSSST